MRQQEKAPRAVRSASLSRLSINDHVYAASVAIGDGDLANVFILM